MTESSLATLGKTVSGPFPLPLFTQLPRGLILGNLYPTSCIGPGQRGFRQPSKRHYGVTERTTCSGTG